MKTDPKTVGTRPSFKRRIVASIFSVLFLPGAFLRGNPRQENKESEILSLQVVMPHAKVCVGSRSVVVKAQLKNVSGQDIAVAPGQLHYAYAFFAVPKDGGTWIKDRGSINDSVPIDWPNHKSRPPKCVCVVLRPGESLKKSVKLDLGEPAFFDKIGIYTVRIRYGVFDDDTFKGIKFFTGVAPSNEFTFSVEPCKNSGSD